MISLRDVVTGFGNRDPLAEVWRRDLRSGGIAEITGTLPLRYIGNGKPLTDYMIYGNTVQNGTPSPKAPVDVMGCGVWDETRQSYKLPPTVNGVEYPIYLGQVETMRRIRKLVLDGTESTWLEWSGLNLFRLPDTSRDYRSQEGGAICDSLPLVMRGDLTKNTFCWSTGTIGEIIININNYNLADLKTYLSSNPITVYYVLATPEIVTLNEPLHKIGDYADTISFAQAGATIPTVSGANVLDMTSNVKPSEVYIKGKGIKPTGYGQLVDNNSVRILDKNNVRILVHGQ